MKKLLLPLAAILLLALAVPAAFSEAELGIGLTPGQVANPPDPNNVDPILNFHVGWSWTILYLSWDAFAMPDYWVYNATYYTGAYYVPGFLNMFDVGLKIVLRPFIAYATVGGNMLYLRGGQTYNQVGVNARLGAGVKFGFWGVNLSGTQVFASTSDMSFAFREAFHGNASYLVGGMVPTLNLTFYF
jgi:hypothetical protein